MKKVILLLLVSTSLVLSQDMIVRVYVPSWKDLKQISEKPLDIAAGRYGEWYDLVVDERTLDEVIASGLPYEITVHSLEYEKEKVRGAYLSYTEINDSLMNLALNYPSHAKFDSLPITTYEGRWIYGLKISDNVDVEEDDEPKFTLDGCHHSREWATPQAVLFFADSMLKSYGVVSEITEIINTTEIYCFPLINVDGYVYDYPGQNMWRKNREPFGGGIGTDPNRNYGGGCNGDVDGYWGAADEGQVSHGPSAETFCGAYAYSGDEIQAYTAFIREHNITTGFSLHSYGEQVMYPWGYKAEGTPDSMLYDEKGAYIAGMMQRIAGGTYTPGQSYSNPYPSCGNTRDWVYGYNKWVAGLSSLFYGSEIGTAFYQDPSQLDFISRQVFKAAKYLAGFADSLVLVADGFVAPPVMYPLDTVYQSFTVYWHATNSFDNHPTQWELVELSNPSVIEDDLESGTGRWALEGFTLSTSQSHSSSHSLFSGSQNNMNHAVRTAHPYLVQSGDSLSFWCWFDLEDDCDVAVAEISENTKEWFSLDTARFNGSSGGWVRKAYSLEDWVGKSVYFRFRSMTDGNTLGSGFYIDDITPLCLFADVDTISSSITDTSYYFTNHLVGDFYYIVRGYNTTYEWGDYSCLEFVTVDIPPTGPYLTLGSLIVDDAGGNGQVNPGEVIDLGIWVENIGIDTAYDVYGLLSESDPYASLDTDSSWFGDIPEDDSSQSNPYYRFTVANDCPNKHTISFTLELHDGDDSTWTPYPSVTVYAPVLSFVNVSVVNDGNSDGVLDPGETADLVVTIENEGGAQAENVLSTLLTTSPYITINDSSGNFGSIDTGTTTDNASDPYTVTAGSGTPTGTLAHFEIEVVSGVYVDTLGFSIVVGKEHYYLWNPDPTPTPGQKMDSILNDLGYTGDYGTALAPDLTLYQSVLVCVGVYPNNYVIGSSSPEAAALVDFLENHGGRMYLEGGDVWYWDPFHGGGFNFGPLFGINATADGHSNLGPVVGESGVFTEGMDFTYGGENSFIDYIDPTGTGFLIFHDGNDYYNCGVANDPGTYRTVGTSFELGLLVDDTPPSTRSLLLDRVIQWLGSGSEPDVTPPVISDVAAMKVTAADLLITWNTSETDTLGYPETMSHYVVYRDTLPDFIPGSLDSIGMAVHPDTEYVDSGALLGVQSYYYLVKAVDAAGNRSKKSNMAYAFRKTVNEDPAATDKNWVSLPYICEYDTVSDLTDDLSPDGNPLVKVTNLRDDQLYESWSYTTIPIPRWTGTNFAIESGRAYEMVTITDDTLVLVGCNEPEGLISLNENAGLTDKNLISIPYNALYGFVEDITDEYASSGDPLVKITNLRDDQLYESWSYTTIPTPRWTGTNFSIEAGRGYEFATIVDTTWNPTEYSNESTRCLAIEKIPKLRFRTHVGVLTEPDGAVLRVTSDRNYVPTTIKVESNYREAGISHLIRGYVELNGCEDFVFTAYHPERPHDVLTENMVGSGFTMDDEYVLFWFDVGNFKKPWQEDDKITLVIGGSQNGTWYFTGLKFELDKHVDIQELGKLEFVSVSQGSQGGSETPVPIDYAFNVLPNPFVIQTRVDYALPKETSVEMVIYDVSGRQVKTLVSEMHKPGYYSKVWNGVDEKGRKVPSGIYFIRFTAGEFKTQDKILLVK